MRYSIRAGANVTPIDLISDVHMCNGSNIQTARRLGVSFADMSPNDADKLKSLGYIVNPVKRTGAPSQVTQIEPPSPVTAVPTYTPADISYAINTDILKQVMDPPLSGSGVNVAVLDTGIRESHSMLQGRVVMSRNFTESGGGDGFNHGTGVASIIVGISPLINVIDCKVLDDTGEGTEEESVLALDMLVEMHENNDVNAPDIINMSIGTEDDGNSDSILRLAIREALDAGIWIFAAAGNSGPGANTVLSPAAEQNVVAVGSCKIRTLEVSEFSSRGPSDEGLVKPDCMLFGENLLVASSEDDNGVIAKSGTSFSCPFVTGLFALVNEYYCRMLVNDPDSAAEIDNETLLSDVIPDACGKPDGVSTDKDNAYGYGIFLPELAVEEAESIGINASTMIEGVMMIGMMGMIVSSVGE